MNLQNLINSNGFHGAITEITSIADAPLLNKISQARVKIPILLREFIKKILC